MKMKTKPFEHQSKDFERTKELEIFAVWWEQGLGKSKLIIDTVCHLFATKGLTGLLVIAPNGVHGNFLSQEWPVHCWEEIEWVGHIHYTAKAATKKAKESAAKVCHPGHRKLAVLVMAYDALRTKAGFELAQQFLMAHKAMMVLDESTAIADPQTDRSKRIAKLGPYATWRRVMSGTPVAEGPFKIFNQMKFLDQNYWKRHGYSNFFAFKNAFAIFRTMHASAGHQFQQLLKYQNLDYLQRLIADHSSRVLKEDALDLPPKLYSRVEFDLDSKQRKLYDDLKETLKAELDAEHTLEATTALIRLTRLQQITSGFAVTQEMPPPALNDLIQVNGDGYVFVGEINSLGENGIGTAVGRYRDAVTDSENWLQSFDLKDPRVVRLVAADPKTIELFEKPTDNPRIDALLTILEPITHKVIIWARFTRDLDNICSVLGDASVRYDGRVNDAGREQALHRFRTDDTIRYFVANPAALSMGVTLTQAKTVIYYSNNFQLEKRLQSEDRAHRIGQDTSVNIIDLVASSTVDQHIVATLRKKFDLAAAVTGDRLREWIS